MLVILVGITILLTGCVSGGTSSQGIQEKKTAMLYTNMTAGCESATFETHPFEYTGDLTVEKLAEGLSELTGLDYYITTQSPNDQLKGIIIDWNMDSTLIANLDDREQKEDFFLFDVDSMRWFMMDNLWKTVSENLNYENVFYTMNSGHNLEFDELYPIKEFPCDLPYMGSSFYNAHSGVNDGDQLINEDDAFTIVQNTLKERGESASVIIQNGEETINGEHAFTYSAGEYSEDGQKFTAMYHYAVSDSGHVYSMDALQGTDWVLANNKADFSMFTDMSNAEVRNFVDGVKSDILNEDWTSLAVKISYPIAIGSKTFETEDEFADYNIGSLLSDVFKISISETDCSNLFADYEGVMMGNGGIWITEMLNEDMSSQGLKIYAWNL
jgi:hypothetical protein